MQIYKGNYLLLNPVTKGTNILVYVRVKTLIKTCVFPQINLSYLSKYLYKLFALAIYIGTYIRYFLSKTLRAVSGIPKITKYMRTAR